MRNIRDLKVKLKPNAGFTLLEIMVSISIISIVLVAVYRMHIQTIAMNSSVKFYTTAPLLAHGKIAELEINPSDELTDDSGNFGEEFPGYRWNQSIDDIESKLLGTTSKALKKIDVTISFNNDELTYNLRKYRFVRD
ncbi:MAG: prepilin-type N-terminal cleavage/methylation domain-containing protein [Deltaproteobacteria bacterium]|nr:prepilin-type N-terminal cleavage/methylation domain-containing protein [Deltaproteobacteria bacterium]